MKSTSGNVRCSGDDHARLHPSWRSPRSSGRARAPQLHRSSASTLPTRLVAASSTSMPSASLSSIRHRDRRRERPRGGRARSRSSSRVQVSRPLAVWKRTETSGGTHPSQSTCALASVACPHRSTSTVGVNQRNPNSAPAGLDERGLREVHLGRDRLHPRHLRRLVEQAHRGGVAPERGLGERVDHEQRGAHLVDRHYSMMTRTAPVPTVSPGAHPDLGDLARTLGRDVVLHLHRLEHQQRLAGFDRRHPRPRAPSRSCPASAR